MVNWPDWWGWEIELSPHLLKRMVDRQFNETDLRLMLENASAYRPVADPLRWVVETTHEGYNWEVVVEPVPTERVVVVVTAYRLGT